MADKVLPLLGLCRRAGKLEGGFDMCALAARHGEAKLLLAAATYRIRPIKIYVLKQSGRAYPAPG